MTEDEKVAFEKLGESSEGYVSLTHWIRRYTDGEVKETYNVYIDEMDGGKTGNEFPTPMEAVDDLLKIQ